MHQLYRERIVQEDNLINHRMMWMVLSQAFLLGAWGVLLQRAIDAHSPEIKIMIIMLAVIGIVFALGSLFSIKAAHDEIANLRANYLVMLPAPTDLNKPSAVRKKITLKRLKDVAKSLSEYLSVNSAQFEHPSQDIPEIREKLRKDPLPGLTGSRNFHWFGHIVPRYMPGMIILLWLILIPFVVATPVGVPASGAEPHQQRSPS